MSRGVRVLKRAQVERRRMWAAGLVCGALLLAALVSAV